MPPKNRKLKVSDLGEFGLIDLLKKDIKNPPSVIEGIGDDAAVLPYTDGKYLLLTADMLVEGVHFTKAMDPFFIGRKAMACNISDIVAMGGVPKYAVVSLGVDPHENLTSIQRIYAGMNHMARMFGVSIVGGDTVKSKDLSINIALTGEVKKKNLVRRKGAKKGDIIFVTGKLGDSLKSRHHLKFIPRVKESQFLVERFKPTAMIDISDGLSADLSHILKQSKAGAVLDESRIPIRRQATLNQALHEGEDFELLFTLPPHKAVRLKKQKAFRFYDIGVVVSKKNQLLLMDRSGKEHRISVQGFKHF